MVMHLEPNTKHLHVIGYRYRLYNHTFIRWWSTGMPAKLNKINKPCIQNHGDS